MKKLLICLLIVFLFQLPGFCTQYIFKKLNSGQIIIAAPIKNNPVVTINTWVKTGSINENDTNSGVAHFLEHLFFKGSKNVPAGEFDKILESKGAVTNAATSKDYTQFYITIPSKDFDLALKLHSDMLLNPLIPENELEKERFVVLEEIARGLDNPSNVLYNDLFELIYNKHPYKRPVIGSKEIISNITRQEILDFYNKWYTPSNMITVIAGDIDAKNAIQQAQTYFEKPAVKSPKVLYPSISPIDKKLTSNAKKQIAQGYMAIAYKAPKFTNSKDTYALDILAIVLGGSGSSVLNLKLKEKSQLVNSIGASYSQYLDDGLFIISSKFDPAKDISLIQKEIFEEIEKIQNGAVTKQQVQKAKNIIKTGTAYARESSANIANELGFFTFYYNNPKMYDEYLSKIDSITQKDVIMAANKYLDSQKTAISTVLPENCDIISPANDFTAVSNIAAAAKANLNGAQIIEENNKQTKYLLDNNATLIVQKNKSNSIIAFDIFAKGGSYLAVKPGLAYLAAQTALRGSKNKTSEEISSFLDEKGIRFSISSNPDAFNISMMTTKNNLNDAFDILNETINQPVFLESEIDKVKTNYKQYAASLLDRPLAFIIDEFSAAAYKNYPYSNNTKVTLQYLDDITRQEIIDYYNKILDSKNIVIAVSGDVDEDLIIQKFNQIFQDKNQNKVELKDFLKTTYIPDETYRNKISNSGKNTSWIITGYKTNPIYDIKQTAILKVINSLLGSGMSSRLFTSLRENQGLAYQVGSTVNQYANDGAIIAYIGTNSKNETLALNGLNAEFERLKTELVPNDELQEAKEKLLGNMTISLETNMDNAELLAKYTAFNFDLSYYEKLRHEISNVSSQDILTFANKHFSKPHFEIIMGE